jgi:hypothetical protein
MASDDTASHLAISIINCEMDLLRSAGEAYAAQLTASGVKAKVELIEGAQHSSLNLSLTPRGAQSLKLIVGLTKLALHWPQSPPVRLTLLYRTYVLKKCRDGLICSVAKHFSIRRQWRLPFVATVFHRIESVTLNLVLLNTFHRSVIAFLCEQHLVTHRKHDSVSRTWEVAPSPAAP